MQLARQAARLIGLARRLRSLEPLEERLLLSISQGLPAAELSPALQWATDGKWPAASLSAIESEISDSHADRLADIARIVEVEISGPGLSSSVPNSAGDAGLSGATPPIKRGAKFAAPNIVHVANNYTAAASGPSAEPTTMGPLAQPTSQTYPSANVPVAIPQIGTVTSTLTVPNSFTITDINVQLNITHTYDSDLDVFLIGPDGTRVELFTDVGSNGDNFTGTILDDEAPSPIVLSAVPFTGEFSPEGLLRTFDGKNAQGVWTLEVTDDTSGDSGAINSWSLIIVGAPAEAASPVTLGVSQGVSWFQVDGAINVFGDEDVYAIDLVAGQRISASVQTPENGGSGAANSTDVAIPDNNTPVTSSIDVPAGFTIEDLDVSVLIDHLSVAHLDVFLIAPNGTRIELSTDNGGTGDFYFNTRFDDDASVQINDASAKAPFGGRFRPESPLSVLDGLSAGGIWQLEITDDTAGTAGTLLGWGMEFNVGLDSTLRIVGPGGELAYNDDAVSGSATDSAIVSVVVPTTGRYFLQVGSLNYNTGAYTLEAGIYDAAVTGETGTVTDLNPIMTGGNGNAVVLGQGDGIAQSDAFTATLNAGESVVIAASTPGGFYNPRLVISGPGGFLLEANDGGASLFDAVTSFDIPANGVYTITVDYAASQEFNNVVSQGSYALSLIVVDNATNNSLANARPISTFNYAEQVETTSDFLDPPLTGVQGAWFGQADFGTDEDYFSLGELTSGELIRLSALRPDGAGQLYAKLLLFNSAGEFVSGAGPVRSGPNEGAASFETVLSETDEYFAYVTGDTTEPGGATYSAGPYVLIFSRFGVVEDPYENNDSRAEVDAEPAGAPDSPNLGAIGAVTALDNLAMRADSEDWFRFQTTAPGKLGDYARIEFAHTDGDLDLVLLDAAGNVIETSNSTVDHEQVNLHGLPAGVYYVRVHGYLGATNRSYNLRLQTQSPDHRLLSAPFTTDVSYTLQYELTGSPASSLEQLVMGENLLIVTAPSGGPEPFELIFDITRVGTMADQTSYQYDLLDNLSRSTDALGRDTQYTYDGLGRLVDRNGPGNGDLHLFSYDGNNNLTNTLDSTGQTGYAYDALDRLTTITLAGGLGTVDYTYDLAGRVTSISYPDGTLVAYGYDAAGRLASVAQGADVTTYTYYADGLLHTTTLPNGITSTYVYDTHARLTDLVHTRSGGLLVSSFHYTMDAEGNRTSMEVRRPNTGTPAPNDFFSSLYTYQYDALDRLTQAAYPDGRTVVYTYDANGNRLSTSTDPDGNGPSLAVVEDYHYGHDNRLESITGVGAAVLKQFFYDPRGNMVMLVTPTGTTHYEYDFQNMLIAVEDGTNRIEYEYDANGDRVSRTINGVRTTFINDPNQEFTQVLLELGPSGAVQARYTYGAGRIAGLLPGQASPAYYLADALGSTADLTSTTGSVLRSYSYDAFGALRVTDAGGASGDIANEFLYTGERVEPGTGQAYLRARFYDASTGRLLQKDPSGFVDGSNLYVYTNGNPVNKRDPSGRITETELVYAGYATVAVMSAFTGGGLDDGWVGVMSQHASWLADIRSTINASSGPMSPVEREFTSRLRSNDAARRYSAERLSSNSFYNPFGSRRIEATFSSSRGGVLLNRAVDFVGDLSSITGATVDPATGQVVLQGTAGAAGVPDLTVDDFVTAVRAIFGSAEDPGVTLDPQPGHESNPNVPQLAHLFGGLEDTDMGWVLLEADRVMKTLVAAEDNVTGTAVSSGVAGYRSVLDRWFQRELNGGRAGKGSRFWFVPSDVKLVRSDDGQSFVFDRTAVRLLTEDSLLGNGSVDPDAQAFAEWFTSNYDAIAQESYNVYDYSGEGVGTEIASQMRIFARLEQVAKAIAFARFLYDNDIPIDFSWMENYDVPERNTPLEVKTVHNQRTGSIPGGTITIIVTGGVTMDRPNSYLPDTGTASTAANSTLASRPDELAQSWQVPATGQTAVALSLDSAYNDGTERRADTDLSYKTAGDVPLGLTRYYDSTSPTPGAMGFGWEFLPYELEFSRPEFFSSDRSPYTFLNGLRTGEIRISNQATGQILTFQSSFVTGRDSFGNFGYDGLNLQGVPSFTAGGSELPDGSALVQDPATLNYTLIMPNGAQTVFDRAGRLLRQVDNRSRAVTYGYAGERVTSISDAAGQTITLAYDPQGRISQAVGLGGEVVNFAYDAAGDLTSAARVRQAAHVTYSYTYDAEHRLTSVTLPDQVVDTTNVSDLLGRTTARGDSRGNQFSSNFDMATRTTITTDSANGMAVTQRTDSLNRPLQVTDELGRTTSYFYLGQNRQPTVVQTPDPGRPELFYLYDSRGNLILSEDPVRGGDANHDGQDDNPIWNHYDANNNLIQRQDARGLITKYVYNGSNQPTSMTRGFGTPQAATSTWDYDPVTGFLASQTDPSGVVTEFQYDARGNLIRQTIAAGTLAETSTFYAYDAFSRRISTTDGAGRVTTFEYNGRDQVIATTMTGPPALASGSSYDPLSGRKLTDTDFNSHTKTFNYDATTGDLLQENDNGSITSYTYDRFGNIARIVDPVGNVTVFEYDVLQRLSRVRSLGSTPRVTELMGNSTEMAVSFSEPIDTGLVDNGIDVLVRNGASQVVSGSISFSADARTMTWVPTAGILQPDTYSITLRAGNVGEFTSEAGVLLDGEFFGLLPSGDNTAGGDFIGTWLVDDHGNDATHATSIVLPVTVAGDLEFAGDADWFRFDVVAGNRFAFEVLLGSLSDSVLRLYGPDGETVLELNDDIDVHTAQYASRIEWQAAQTGAYYLSVRGFGDRTAGTYQLQTTLLQDDHADAAATATAVGVPSLSAGRLEVPADNDVFSFQAVAGTQYRIATILGTLNDSLLRLYDTDGTSLLTENNDYAGGTAARLYWTAPSSGTYFVGVSSFNAEADGTYELALSVDDHGDDAPRATLVPLNTTRSGDLEVKRDHDWFAFDVVAGADYRLTTTAGSLVFPQSTLYSANGVSPVPSNQYSRVGANVYWTAPATGRFYLRVQGLDSTGTYTVGVNEIVDDHPNLAPGTSIALPGTVPGALEKPADVDVFAFHAAAGAKYRLEVALGDLPDSVLTLFDTDGVTVLDTNDDFQGLASRIDFVAPATGTFLARVASLNGGFAGSYTFSVQMLELVPPAGELVFPIPGSTTNFDNGYVDVSWTDAGGSGLDTSTVDMTDVTISGVTVVSVQSLGSGIWRYTYSGPLPQGAIQVTLSANHVRDFADNWNNEVVDTFYFDNLSPTADIVDVVPDPRATAVNEIQVRFSEPVAGFDLGDLVLTRDGGINLLPATATLASSDAITWTLGNLIGLTAMPGAYQLSVLAGASITDLVGNLLSGSALDAWAVQTNTQVLGRRIFYNQSKYDSNNAAINANDDLAIATDKSAYLPGSGAATFANVSSYTKGINGIMIDLAGTHGTITLADFAFRVGNNNTPNSWVAAPAPNSISVRAGAGVSGSDRVVITWANGAITKKWLEVIVLANGNTGLAQKAGYPAGQGDVFFFGSAPGDTGFGDTATQANVSVTDELGARNHPAGLFNNVPITSIYDFNRDAQVNTTDTLAARNNPTSIGNVTRFLTIANPPAAPEASPASNDGAVASALTSSSGAGAGALGSVGIPRWLVNRLDSIDLNSGPIAKFFQHLHDQNTLGTRKVLQKADAIADELGLNHDLLESLLADLGLES